MIKFDMWGWNLCILKLTYHLLIFFRRQWRTRPGRCRIGISDTHIEISSFFLAAHPISLAYFPLLSRTIPETTRDPAELGGGWWRRGWNWAGERRWSRRLRGGSCSSRWCWWSGRWSWVGRRVPLFAEESAVETGQEGADPKYEKHVGKTVVYVLFLCLYADGDGEDEADEQWPPEIPIPQFLDGGLPISGDHEKGVLDFLSDAEKLSFLDRANLTRVSQESSSKF